MSFSHYIRIAFLIFSGFVLTACSTATTPAPVPASVEPVATVMPVSIPVSATVVAGSSSTPDPCAPENVSKTTQELHRFTRAFDDTSAIASNTVRNQLSGPVAELQKIRRETEDFLVPACLERLKQFQLGYMNTTISTLLGFMGGKDQEITNKGIEQARNLHDLYLVEMAHVLGITVVVLPSYTPNPQALTPPAETTGTPQASATGTPTAAFSIPEGAVVVTNAGPSTVNLRRLPSFTDSESVGLMLVGDRAVAVARNSDSTWYLVEIPGQKGKTAWVFAKLVTLSAAPDVLPIATQLP